MGGIYPSGVAVFRWGRRQSMVSFWRSLGAACVAATLLGIFIVSLDAAPQSSAQLTVTVLDPTGGRIAGANVVLSNPSGERTFTTSPEGTVEVSGLPPGEWTMTVTRD